ncbi:MAG TPA: ATP-binding protein [Fusobacterium sp.]|uniref:ATP-binding protein n=1 Tax=Fusobacterium sp. TaxID=68766 RepID=UPI002F403372
MEKHRSKPFNPNIANGFFRAGFIETWGRGIEKICESCKNYGIKLPEYTVYPEDIMVKFEALNTAKNTANKIDENIQFVLDYLKEYPSAKQKHIMEDLHVSRRTLERITSLLKERAYIERVGNNRSGYWKIKK